MCDGSSNNFTTMCSEVMRYRWTVKIVFSIREGILQLFGLFPGMWGRFGSSSALKNRIELTPRSTPVNLGPYRAIPNVPKYRFFQILRMLSHDDNDLTWIEWAASNSFSIKKHGALLCSEMYRRLMAASKRESYVIVRTDALDKYRILCALEIDSKYWTF